MIPFKNLSDMIRRIAQEDRMTHAQFMDVFFSIADLLDHVSIHNVKIQLLDCLMRQGSEGLDSVSLTKFSSYKIAIIESIMEDLKIELNKRLPGFYYRCTGCQSVIRKDRQETSKSFHCSICKGLMVHEFHEEIKHPGASDEI